MLRKQQKINKKLRKYGAKYILGRDKGVEPLHNRATICRVNHFTNPAIWTLLEYQIFTKKSTILCIYYNFLWFFNENVTL